MAGLGLQSRKTKDMGLIVAGVLMVIVAIVFIAWPGGSLKTLTVISGIIFLLSGISDLVGASRVRGTLIIAPWMTTYGVLDIILGVALIAFPSGMSVVLPWIMGFTFVVFGIFELSSSRAFKQVDGSSWGMICASGVIGIICGILLFAKPASIMVFMGIYFAVRGISLIVHGMNASYSYI